MKKVTTNQFQKIIFDWYKKNGRHDLPWRKTKNPYHILVSEIMLQQTQIPRVLSKYTEWIEQFPAIESLANASQKQVLSLWQGLGYNRRALFLQRAVQIIHKKYGGKFPKQVSDMEKLPGIGPYTAGAVAVFSQNQPHVLLETNIRRVILHFFFSGKEKVADSEIISVLRRVSYFQDPRKWYWALMDYGAGPLKKIINPNRRSTQYRTQSRFEGSSRFVRAKIVSFLLRQKSGAVSTVIIEEIESNPQAGRFGKQEEIVKILSSLEQEGFIVRKGQKWFIK
ncbi:A/G-specific adenine glycosylase [Candidatus Uhrbacteria bacterium]|nr:A/G-specific adenine glycosylase [Candidatus Uhrbacteria bacterium]